MPVLTAPVQSFIPSKYQRDFFAALLCTRDNLQLVAAAGSGKTKSIEEALRQLPAAMWRNTLVTAFNAHIKEELKDRQEAGKIPAGVNISTIHGLGYSALRKHLGVADTRSWVDKDKYRRLLDIAWADFEDQDQTLAEVERSDRDDAREAARDLLRLALLRMVDTGDPDALASVVRLHEIKVPARLRDQVFGAVEKAARWGREGTPEGRFRPADAIDYEDMLALPIALGARFWQYELAFVDEAQDLSRAQLEVVLRSIRPGGRIVMVADPHQCQPPGTMVTLTGGEQVPIENLQPGQEVVSFAREGGAMVGRRSQGRKVLSIAERHYDGPLLEVTAGEKSTQCTTNHRWVARFATKQTGLCVVYVMAQGSRYRVGWCQLFEKNGNFHLGVRTRIECADRAWILEVFESRTEASVYESIVAAKYGLPTMPFHPVNGARHITQEAIDQVFQALDRSTYQESRAAQCLTDHGRDICYPFYTLDKRQRQGRTTIFETQACNLIPDLMAVPVYDGGKAPVWTPIKVTVQEYEGPVYSLSVDTHQTYIADGIATHNSIYNFAGADADAFDVAQRLTGAKRLPLSICYRCGRRIVDLARRYNPAIEPAADAIEGAVVTVDEEDLLSLAEHHARHEPDTFLILARMNAPLVSAALQLLRRGVSARILGRDISITLVRSLDEAVKTATADTPLTTAVGAWALRKMAALSADDEAGRMVIADRSEALRALIDSVPGGSIGQVRARILELFADESRGVVLSTIHKAKGLEARRVGILKPEMMPLPYAKSGVAFSQEQNLCYVAVTRAREELYLAGALGGAKGADAPR